LLKEQARLDEAETHLRRAVAADANYEKAWLELGRVQRDRGSVADALVSLARVPALTAAHEEMGLIEQARGRYVAAISNLRAALLREPDRPVVALALGFCLQETGEVDAALDVYRAALSRDRSLYGPVVKNLTAAAKGRLWLRPADLRRALALGPG
jgi:tetratricopeptide (TPR) repeat protein